MRDGPIIGHKRENFQTTLGNLFFERIYLSFTKVDV
jgi:hypothetical protein